VIIPEECPTESELEERVKVVDEKIGPLVIEGHRYKVLCALWTWRDLNKTGMRIPATDLIKHRVILRKGCVPYATNGWLNLASL